MQNLRITLETECLSEEAISRIVMCPWLKTPNDDGANAIGKLEYAGAVLRCFRLSPRSGQLAALVDGTGKRPSAR
jgi:hypothetical protein